MNKRASVASKVIASLLLAGMLASHAFAYSTRSINTGSYTYRGNIHDVVVDEKVFSFSQSTTTTLTSTYETTVDPNTSAHSITAYIQIVYKGLFGLYNAAVTTYSCSDTNIYNNQSFMSTKSFTGKNSAPLTSHKDYYFRYNVRGGTNEYYNHLFAQAG